MKFIYNIIMSIILLFPIHQALAVENINGAFGLEFGQRLDASIPTKKIDSSSNEYYFKPKKGFRSLAVYTLTVTPESRLIYIIRGFGYMKSESSCIKELDIIMSILENKYGKKHDDVEPEQYSTVEIIVGKKRGGIRAECQSFDSKSDENANWGALIVHYADKNLHDQATKEDIKMLDSSGL